MSECAMDMRAFIIGVTGCLLCGACAAQQMALYTLEWAPYSWRAGGKVLGISSDIVAELMTRAGLAAGKPVIVPWARGLSLTTSNAGACLFPVGRVPERENRYQWIGPIGHSEWVLFARSADRIVLHNLEEARPYLIGTMLGDLSVSYLREKNLRLDIVASDRLNPQKMERRRIDLWSSGYLPALHLLRELGVTDLQPVLTLTKVDLYLACNRRMPDAEAARLNGIVAAMLHDQTIGRIYGAYGYASETPQQVAFKLR
ncbi:polar amino acid transport system substrate-binding protein [Oxalobacteraceae bacterium GrIS 1.11]